MAAISGSPLSKVSVTSAMPCGPRCSEPLKMTSDMARPRRCLALCSPIAQRMESTMLDLPQPLGPTMPTTSESKWMTVRSTNDLKPLISSLRMRMGGPTARSLLQAAGGVYVVSRTTIGGHPF